MSSAAPHIARRLDPREKPLVWGVAGLTVAAPAAIGGAHPATQVLLAASAVMLLAVYTGIRGKRGLRPVPLASVATLALAFTMLQLLPLPSGMVGILSPHAREVHADVAPAARWMTLSVDATATWLACARAIACLALLLVVGGSSQSRRQVFRFLTIVVATAAGLAVVAAVQRLTGTSTILGFYHPRSPPGFGVFGTFVDVNHAASLLILGALTSMGLCVESLGRKRSYYLSLAALLTCALLFTTSRGAVVAFAVAAFALTVILASRSMGLTRAVVGATVLLLLGTAATLWINEGLRARVADRQMVDNQKTRGWADGMRLAAGYPWTGAGRGTFESAIGAYRTNDEGVRLAYPENIIVQLASEWGFPFALLVIGVVLTTAARMAPSVARASPAVVGGACGVLAVVIHDFMDFGLEMPGVAIPTTVVLATVVGRITAEQGERSSPGYRLPATITWPALGLASLAVVVAALQSGHSLDADFARLHDYAVAHTADAQTLHEAIVRHPADDYLALLAAEQSFANRRPDAMHEVNRALRLHPSNWQAHRLAAHMLVTMNRPAQAALEYRLALEHGMTLNTEELGRVLQLHVVDAVPQTPARLIELARGLYAAGMIAEADAAAQRAVDRSDTRQLALMSRVQLALDANAAPILPPAARALLAEAETPEAFALAARALSRCGTHIDAGAAVEKGLQRHPDNGSLLLVGAELRIAANDIAGARDLLHRGARLSLTLRERQRAEDLLAEIADRSGDVEGAIVARAHSRLIAKQLRDMTVTEKAN